MQRAHTPYFLSFFVVEIHRSGSGSGSGRQHRVLRRSFHTGCPVPTTVKLSRPYPVFHARQDKKTRNISLQVLPPFGDSKSAILVREKAIGATNKMGPCRFNKTSAVCQCLARRTTSAGCPCRVVAHSQAGRARGWLDLSWIELWTKIRAEDLGRVG